MRKYKAQDVVYFVGADDLWLKHIHSNKRELLFIFAKENPSALHETNLMGSLASNSHGFGSEADQPNFNLHQLI